MIVPSLDVRAGRVAFRSGVAGATGPRDLAARFVAAGAEELHLVDLDGAEHGAYENFELLADIARSSGVPCRLAGGLADLARAEAAFAAGFAGVLFSSAVFGDPALLGAIAALAGRATVEVESRDGRLAPRGGGPALVAAARGRDAVDAALAAVNSGVRSLYVIELATEGALGGPALGLLGRIRAALGPRAASVTLHTGGGVRDLADIAALARAGCASVVVGRALAEGRFTLAAARAAAA